MATGVGLEAGVKRPVLTKWCWLKTARLPRIMVRGSRVYQEADFSFAAQVAARLAGQVAERGLPPGALLNVNVPAVPPEEIAGVMVTRMGLRIYYDELVRRVDPRGRPYYWIGGDEPGGVLAEGTDLWRWCTTMCRSHRCSLI